MQIKYWTVSTESSSNYEIVTIIWNGIPSGWMCIAVYVDARNILMQYTAI